MNDAPETKDLSGEEKRALLERLLLEKASRVKTSHPLSHGQQALWFLHQDAPESPAYNVAVVFRILSPVDVSALRSVFQTLLSRHPSLRSTFSQPDGQPAQIVQGHQDVYFEEIDASMDTGEELQRRVTEAYQRPFDLEQGPLLRVSLFTRAPEEHVLLIVMHHIVTDGWSDWALLSELLLLYPALKAGQSATLPPLTYHYRDFVKWQAELLASPEGERLWKYWRERLSGELPVLDLPTDRPRPPVQTHEGASVFFTLPEPLTRKLRDQAQASGATLYMILLAAFQILLHRYTGQDDILVGAPAAGRSRSEFEGIVGYFVNPIVLRARLEGNPSFAVFLDQVRQTLLEGLAHQDYPFPLLVERLQPTRDTSHSPIFQVMFALRKAQQDDDLSALLGAGDESFSVNKNGLLLAPFRMAQQEGQFDLALGMTETKQSLSGAFQYNTDLFEAETTERMAGHFVRLLEGIVAAPEAEISRLPLLTEVEQARILVEWNDTKAPYPADKCIHELFEEQVAKSPDAVAVVFEDEEVSYGELNARANRLAHRLRALGVGPETLVGLLVERSVEMIVGLLAILKAGGAYVPLDPAYPQERLAFMAEDAELKLLLCHGSTREGLPECPARILDLDAEAAAIAGESSANPVRLAGPDNLAYVIYTSGSTGKPKGVMTQHRGCVNYIIPVIAIYELGDNDTVLQFSSITFDSSVDEIFTCLSSGGRLIPRTEKMIESPQRFLETCRDSGVTVLYLPTSYWHQIISEIAGIMNESFVVKKKGRVGDGLFSTRPYKKGEMVLKLEGEILDHPTRETVQLGKNKHIRDKSNGVFMNHSCYPNTTIKHDCVIAIRDIRFGDEITFDYCETEDKLSNPFICDCCNNLIAGKFSAKERTPDPELSDAKTHNFIFSRRLRLVIIGGENALPDRLKIWNTLSGYSKLVNGYGPTEASIAVTFWAFDGTEYIKEEINEVPIGRPIANMRTYILDQHRQPVPIGVPGELHIAGIGLARGYLNQPELTAEKFIDVELLGKTERVYKTGDLCRWLPDGNIEFLGRIDTQVKIRGFRIECGEVENALSAHPGIREAVVDARGEGVDRQLVAWVVAESDNQPALRDELRAHLRGLLPDWMVPAGFVFLKALPLTPSGKIDRRALPDPDADALGTEAHYAAPRDPVEETLCGIFAQVLGVSRVGIQDGFFALGGHSLLATRVVSQVREHLAVELPLRTLFEYPTPAGLARAIAELSGSETLPPVVAIPRDGPLAASFAQERLWVLDRLEGSENVTYSIPFAVRLRGALEVSALSRALSQLAARHESLRTHFAAGAEGPPTQVILPAGPSPLPSEAVTEAALVVRLREEAARPFDLATGPLFRALLFRTDELGHVLFLNVHHIVFDGWSGDILQRELGELYNAEIEGRPPVLPAASLHYADYAAWQRGWLAGETQARQLDWWREHLAGAPALLELPWDHPRPPLQDFRGGQVPVVIPSHLGTRLAELGRGQGATLFMVLHAAFCVLLARLSGQEDIVVGTPVAGRRHASFDHMIGFFVNTLALRADLAGDPGFGEVLSQVRERALAAWSHQDVPFERVVDALRPERSLDRTPLFQVLFVLQNTPVEDMTFVDLDVEALAIGEEDGRGIAKFDLLLGLEETAAGEIKGSLGYASQLFKRSTIERWAGHFVRLLEGIVAAPEAEISRLPLLTEVEQARILVEWNDTKTPYPQDTCIHALFEEQVARSPDAMAVVFEDEEVSYGELNARANRLAHRLRALGVGPETLVGLLMERSVEMILGLLAILKAGGAYVPLDPAYPQERLAFMTEDADLKVLLCHGATRESLPGCSARILDLDADAAAIAGESSANPARLGSPDNLAYVIYTSGSTGKPKGVAMSHAGLVNLLAWQRAQFRGEEEHVVLQFAPLSFDVSFQDILSTLYEGSTLVLVGNDVRRDFTLLIDHLIANEVDRIFLPFIALQNFASISNSTGKIPDLKEVITAGEQLQNTDEIQTFFGRLPGCILYNQYGPTETHVVSSYALKGDVSEWPELPPIGSPIANIRLYIFDVQKHPVPIGVPGELYIGGVGVARGYLNRPDLTAERFIPDPFSQDPDARLYRTGDLCRWLPDGNIEFLGRIDTQVKIRGFRIECGEVENTLLAHPGIREAVVDARGEGVDRQLVAWVVAESDDQPALRDALRAHLRGTLPDWMVPAGFVFLEALPLTPSGKIDRRALPDPDVDALGMETQYTAPRDPVEETLCGIFAQVLGVSRVGIHDGFFALGGHSLLATRVVSQVREHLAVELPLRTLFEHPTPAGLARAIAELSGSETLPPVVAIPRDAPLAASFAQERLWVLDRLEDSENATYSIPFAVRLRGALEVSALARAISQFVARHESLRTLLAEGTEGSPTQVILPAGPIPLPSEAVTEAALVDRLREEAARPFDLATGPLFRALLFHTDELGHVLFLNVHHIVFDGWSGDILLRELGELYNAEIEGRPPVLPAASLHYADYAAWQRGWLTGDVLARQLDWWREHLVGAPALLELPWDRPRPPLQDFRGGQVPVIIPPHLGTRLAELGRRHGATLFMVLHTAFCALLARLSGQETIVVGTPVAGRRHASFDHMIGLFVNTLALRADLAGDPGFEELLLQVRERALAAWSHQDVPFERVVDALRPERSLDRTPLFQAMFALQNTSVEDMTFADLDVEALAVGEEAGLDIAKFDLSLGLEETPGGGMTGALEYASQLFERPTIARWAGHFVRLLEGIVAAPEAKISRLPLLTEAEQERMLVEWNATATPYPQDKCVHALFEEQVARSPDAMAVVFEDEEVSYGELNARANRLAHRLRALGVGPETLVGLLMERSVEMILGLLAILKAGGAYVPLDPAYPQERLAFMTEDADLKVLLCHGATRESLPGCSARILDLDADAAAIAGESSANPARLGSPDNLAYVLYTSGSTGKPKGVMVEHKSLTNLAHMQTQAFGITPKDRVLQFASLNFDASLEQIFSAFLGGARLVLRGQQLWTAEECYRHVCRDRVTVAEFPPAYLHQFLEFCLEDENVSSTLPLKQLVTGGEALSNATVALSRSLGLSLFNTYGPTEATITATNAYLSDDEKITDPIAPIGRPIANVRVYVLDRRMQPVPIGIGGELCIGGAGVARGYLNRPDLTAERFIPDPFSEDPDARLYRTGDRCRWLPDGNIEFLGRVDTQVKIRGFRIECGEVENALSAHPGIREAVVDAHGEGVDKQLVAWVVAASDDQPALRDELRTHLRGLLPDWMVPSLFVFPEVLPLTPSGKIDRRVLPDPDPFQREAKQTFIAPRTSIEKVLVDIWADVLEHKNIGIHDSFFELGGHSLSATRVVSQVRTRLGVELPLRALFEHPTPAGLASAVRGNKEWKPTILFPLNAGNKRSKPPLFCVHPVGGGALCYRDLANCLESDQPVYGIQAVGFEGEVEPLTAIDAMVTRYVEEITTLWPQGPYNLYGWSYGGLIAFEMAHRLRSDDREVALLALGDSPSPLEFEQHPQEPEEDEILLHILMETSDEKLPLFGELQDLTSAERMGYLRERVMGSEFGDLDRFTRIYRANLRAFPAGYRPVPWEGKILSLTAAEEEPVATPETRTDAIWEDFARQIDHHAVPGDHFTMHRQPNVRRIAEILGKYLEIS